MRLKVSYKTPEALLSEFTRSVGRGGVTIESKKSLPVGTRFVFELHAQEKTVLVLVTHSPELAARFADRRRLAAGALVPA